MALAASATEQLDLVAGSGRNFPPVGHLAFVHTIRIDSPTMSVVRLEGSQTRDHHSALPYLRCLYGSLTVKPRAPYNWAVTLGVVLSRR
jgi:hypothetical protein